MSYHPWSQEIQEHYERLEAEVGRSIVRLGGGAHEKLEDVAKRIERDGIPARYSRNHLCIDADSGPVPKDALTRMLYYLNNRARVARRSGFAAIAADFEEQIAAFTAVQDELAALRKLCDSQGEP